MDNTLFEKWVTKQFRNVGCMLKRDADGAYSDHMINAMFIAFCAGRMLA